MYRKLPRLTTVPESVNALSVECPGCQLRQPLPLGDSACTGCGLRFSIRVEEPRCQSCGYLLYRTNSARCPECGVAV